jgi:uncharacterized protein (TIGR02186 family)
LVTPLSRLRDTAGPILAILVAGLLALATAYRAEAATIVADLSRHLIPITTAFGGSDVLLFGTVEEADDVIVLVRGPGERVTVRRKSRFGAIWLNRESIVFPDVPAFYAVAATRPPGELVGPGSLARHGIGLDQLPLDPGFELDEATYAAFRQGLLRTKQREQLYADDLRVRFLGRGLFRTTITFPANVPPGRYQVEVFGIRDGAVVAAQQSALVISKIGFEAQLSTIAEEEAPLYAVAAIGFAVLAGWIAALAFRRT